LKEKTMKNIYKLILLACLVCGCPRSSTTDAGTDIGSDVARAARTGSDASVTE
jgi:hypothetical protein